MKKKGLVAGGVAVIALFAILSPDKSVESIELSIPNYQEEYDINTEIPIELSILPENANAKSLEYVFNGNALEFSSDGIITGADEGTYEIYVTSGNISSNTVTINVVDISAREELLAKAEAERITEEQMAKEAENQKLAEELAAKETENQKLAAELAAKESEEQKLAEEQNAKKTENQKLAAAEEADKVAETQRLAEEQSAKEAETQKAAQESDSQNNTNSSDNSSNFNTYDNASQQQTSATYVLNTNTKKIHHPSCSSVKKIAPQNYSTSNSSADELIGQGYSTCGNCFK